MFGRKTEADRILEAVEREREYWCALVEKLLNRIQDPISEVARSQMDHDEAAGIPNYVDREQTLAEFEAEAKARGLDELQHTGG